MIKTNKDFIPQLAEEFQLAEKEIANILDFYFKEAKSKAEDMVDTDIYLYGLGTLSAKRKKIYDLLLYYEKRKSNVLAKENVAQKVKDRIEEECNFKLDQLKKLLEKYRDQDQRRKTMKLEQENVTRSIQE